MAINLALACAAITFANPLALWDVGFELSASATAGLILFSAPCPRLVRRVLSGPLRRLRALGEDVVATTLAATAATGVGEFLPGPPSTAAFEWDKRRRHLASACACFYFLC